MKYVKQILACMVAISMTISGMSGTVAASSVSAAGSTQQVSAAEAEPASEKAADKKAAEKKTAGKADVKEADPGEDRKSAEKKDEEKSSDSEKTSERNNDKSADTSAVNSSKEVSEKDSEDSSGKTSEEKEKEEGNIDTDEREESSEGMTKEQTASEGTSSASSAADPSEKDSSEKESSEQDSAREGSSGKAPSETEVSRTPADPASGEGSAEGKDTGDTKEKAGAGAGPAKNAETPEEVTSDQAGEAVTTDPVGTMLPIKEEKAYLIIDSDELDTSKVPLDTVFENLMYGDGSKVNVDKDSKAVWAYVKDEDGKVIHDEYHEIQKGTTLDLSSISPSKTTYTFEMIVGKGVQLDYDATRYIVRVFIGDTQTDFVQYHLWKTDKDGKRSEVEPKDVVIQSYNGFGSNGTIRAFILSEMNEGDRYYVGVESLLHEHPLINLRVCGMEDFIAFSSSGNVSAGVMELGKGKEGVVNSDMSDPKNGFPVLTGSQEEIALSNAMLLYYTSVYPEADEEEVLLNTLTTVQFRVVTDAQNFDDDVFAVADNEKEDAKFTSSTTMLVDRIDLNNNMTSWNGYENVYHNRVILKKGYSADREYYYSLNAHSLIWEDANAHVTGAYNDWYHTEQEAKEAGLKDIKDQLLPKNADRNGIYGYKANYSKDKGGQGFTVFFDDGTSFRFSVMFEEVDPSVDYYMKDYDAAPVVGSQDPWFHMTGLMLDGRELDTYIVENGKSINMDTYYGYGYQTVMVNEVLTEDEIARLVPVFEVGDPDRVEIRLPGSDKPLVSGLSTVDFSGKSKSTKDDDIANMVAIIDGHTKNYQVRVISKAAGPKLYVYDDYTDKGGDRFREVLLNDYFEEKHDILIANIGDAPLTGLKVRLELDENADHVKLDEYWNIGGNGNDTLEPFTTTQDLSTYGMIPNVAKIRLLPNGEGDIEGKLIISADGQEDVVIYLSNHARQPEIINESIPDAVRWVPYSCILATNNMYDWNEQTFSISEGELPPGMDLDSETGEIYGAPTTPEERDYEYTFTVKVTYSRDDYFKASEKEYTIRVLDNEDETVFYTSDTSYSIRPEEDLSEYELDTDDTSGYVGERTEDYRFEISSFDYDEVYVSEGDRAHFVKLWLNGEELNPEEEYSTFSGSTVIVINREVLEEKSNKNGERNTISAEFDENGERGDDMKRTSQNYYVVERKDDAGEQSDPGKTDDDGGDDETDSGTQSEDSGTDDGGTEDDGSKEDSTDTGSGETGTGSEGSPSSPSSRQDENDANKPAQGGSSPAGGNDTGTGTGSKTNGSTTTRRSSVGSGSSGNTGSSPVSNESAAVTINAKLVDPAGSALSGYTLEMHSTVKKGQTNASGIASFSGMEMGSHTVYVLNAEGSRLASEKFTLQKGTSFSRSGSTITVVPGQTIAMTITLDGSKASITDVRAAAGNTAAGAATGDDTDAVKWMMLLLAAAVGVLLLQKTKAGRKEQKPF